jgi:hypothetical protein
MSSGIRYLKVLAGAGFLLLASTALQAAQLVTFTRGQSIVVQSSQKRGEWYYFTLEGGGEIGVPAARVASVEEYESLPAPAAPAAALPPAAVSATGSGAPLAAASKPQGDVSVQPPPVAQAAAPGKNPGAPATNSMAPGQDDWRYKVRMGGGPRMGMQGSTPYGLANPGGRVPFGAPRQPPPGQQQRPPQPPQNPQN